MISFRDIINRWKNAEEFGRDLGLKGYSHGRVMKRRNSIPPAYWPKVLEAAHKQNIELTESELRAAHENRAKP